MKSIDPFKSLFLNKRRQNSNGYGINIENKIVWESFLSPGRLQCIDDNDSNLEDSSFRNNSCELSNCQFSIAYLGELAPQVAIDLQPKKWGQSTGVTLQLYDQFFQQPSSLLPVYFNRPVYIFLRLYCGSVVEFLCEVFKIVGSVPLLDSLVFSSIVNVPWWPYQKQYAYVLSFVKKKMQYVLQW